MIFGTLSKPSDEISFLPRAIKEALDSLKRLDFSKLENKKYPVKDYNIDKIFMLVQEYKTKPIGEKNAEQHKRFVDIHYVVSGKEAIGTGVEDPENKIVSEYSAEKDCALFSFVNNETFLTLGQGQYAICFPSDIHRPGCIPTGEKESDVKKIVMKIAVEFIA
jgi:biofilm protein TabA